MKTKKLLSILLAAGMTVSMLAGCGKSETVSNGNNSKGNETSAEPTKIVVALMTLRPMDSSKTDEVEAAINKIAQKKINVIADIHWYDAATYGTQIPMKIQAKEKLDLMMYTPVPTASFNSFMSQNQLMDIGDILKKNAPDVVKTLGDYLKGTTTSKGVLGVPNLGPFSGYETIVMRKDILDQLGLTEKAQNMKTWTDYEAILKEVVSKAKIAGIVNSDAEGTVISPMPYMNGSNNFKENYYYDRFDMNSLVMIDENTNKVISTFSSEEFQKVIERANNWYKQGLIYKDAATAKDYGQTLIKNKVGFSYIAQLEEGNEVGIKASTGFDIVTAKVTQSKVGTGIFTKFGFAVPVTATEPEAAAKFLNLLYSDQEFVNTLTWGIEGKDWVKNDKGMAEYPKGVTADTVNYHTADFLYGNRFLITPWAGSPENIREIQKKENEKAPVSKYLGFSVDDTGIENEVTACANVVRQYKPALVSGSADYKKVYPEFIDKLKAAGIDKVIQTYQKQLDEWLVKNGK
ncbi:ABC transporter substrate-binding protein [Clostridium sp. SYSU_GA19001]|uniref:ABC transporter substrate-binding protein n=1 Tax=Clostridium caldaquaticum TaxID=2940653 RepID=UPI00207736AD|nr:ABC transporter substrate-binding protein [Clostridium caldaquaticum]MCM8709942.1 ABC transporter substrate-binding protein [Clostridium caldaquaticum]